MHTLENLFERFGQRTKARCWIGERPEGHDSQLPRLIASSVGYPTASYFNDNELIELSVAQAAHVLAVAGTTSLAYDLTAPKPGQVEAAARALRDLDWDRRFFSNGLWPPGSRQWSPLTSATFDCGLIGFDSERAFIFWVEEED